MKKHVQEYITYYSPEYIYIPFENIENLSLRSDKIVLNNMCLGSLDNKISIFSPVSGRVLGTKRSKYIDGEKNSLVIENDFIDKRECLHSFTEISKIKKADINKLLEKYGLFQKISSKATLVVESIYDKKHDLGDMVINYESYEEILEAIDELLTLYNIKVCYICIPRDDYVSEAAFNKYINAFPNICIVHSSRKFKNDKCVFYSIEDVLAVYRAIHMDYMLDNTMVTINSPDTTIVRIKLFTSLEELLKTLNISHKNKKIYINDKLIDSAGFVIDSNVRTISIK